MEVEAAKRRIAEVLGRSAPTYDPAGPSFFGHFGRKHGLGNAEASVDGRDGHAAGDGAARCA